MATVATKSVLQPNDDNFIQSSSNLTPDVNMHISKLRMWGRGPENVSNFAAQTDDQGNVMKDKADIVNMKQKASAIYRDANVKKKFHDVINPEIGHGGECEAENLAASSGNTQTDQPTRAAAST